DFGRRLLERLLAPRANGDVDAFLRQRAGDAFADACAAARDQRGLALELKVHVGLLVRFVLVGSAQADLCALRKSSPLRAFRMGGSAMKTSLACEQNASRDIARPQAAESSHRISAVHDRLRRVAHRLDVVAGLEEGDDAAGTTLEALIAPGKRAD